MFIRLSLAALFLSGCRNDCQQVCQNMADIAEDKCEKGFSQDELNQCMDTYRKKNLSAEQLDTCKEYGDTIEKEWDCEDIETYLK
jgi:hypothetical protein